MSKGLFKRTSKRCDQCLYSDARIVSLERKADLEFECASRQTYFVCHKYGTDTPEGDVACRGHLDEFPMQSQMERMAHRLSTRQQPAYQDVVPPKLPRSQ